jgi:hypothetical protein
VAVVDSLHLSGDPRVAALLLAEAVEGVTPADLAAAPVGEGAHGDLPVSGVSMLYAERGQPSQRWTWPGELRVVDGEVSVGVRPMRPEQIVAEETTQHPTCHGDNGAGVYADDGRLAGIVVAARGSGICADTFILAPVAALVEEALAELGVSAATPAEPAGVGPGRERGAVPQ